MPSPLIGKASTWSARSRRPLIRGNHLNAGTICLSCCRVCHIFNLLAVLGRGVVLIPRATSFPFYRSGPRLFYLYYTPNKGKNTLVGKYLTSQVFPLPLLSTLHQQRYNVIAP